MFVELVNGFATEKGDEAAMFILQASDLTCATLSECFLAS